MNKNNVEGCQFNSNDEIIYLVQLRLNIFIPSCPLTPKLSLIFSFYTNIALLTNMKMIKKNFNGQTMSRMETFLFSVIP